LPEEVFLAKNTQHTTPGIIIFGSDQGMCGQFNEQSGNQAMEELARLWLPKADRLILALGARLTAYLEALEQPLDGAWALRGPVGGITPLIQDIVMKIDT